MNNSNLRHLFPGGNTTKGFYSFYRYILSQEDANRIICLKGGPGTGKSSFMKKVSSHFSDLGYSIEHHHCSSDNESLDGIVIKELKVALLDGTSPHVVDPISPGAVDEILNLGVALDADSLAKNKKEIITINKEIGKNFKRAYKFLGAAKGVHEDWSSLNSESLNPYKLNSLISELNSKILTSAKAGFGSDRHLFSTAFTPNGVITYNMELSSNIDSLYVLKGGPGLGKSDVLKALGSEAQKNGYFVEYLHDPFIPERIENILIPEISTGVFTSNEISRLNYNGIEYDMKNLCNKTTLNSKVSEIEFDKSQFDSLVNKALSCITNAHILHDDLESYYIDSMNFNLVDSLYDETLAKISKYI
ncbi:PRK06851 family protein [Clostridium sp. LP20]|uniref:PRK06851 family protein n=1 Tax=Clostridium sp. LP20 TaxID=3418665 RepID=UPI003EE5D93A